MIRGALRDRWARRQFYTDEEEGFTRPEGTEDGPSPTLYDERPDEYRDEGTDENEENEPPTPESDRPRWSRSSSRVRFQDDIDFETRSNASTSSRPVGERWGGYEIPEPEKDLGREVLYQITQQAFNELLDPLFKKSEDDAMDAYAWRDERRRHSDEIDSMLDKFNAEKDILKHMYSVGVFAYVNRVMKALCAQDFSIFRDNAPLTVQTVQTISRSLLDAAAASLVAPPDSRDPPEELSLWVMMLYKVQLEDEIASALEVLAKRQDYIPPETSINVQSKQATDDKPRESSTGRDPTFPQFRPNSLREMRNSSTISSASSDKPAEPLSLGNAFGKPSHAHFPTVSTTTPLSPQHLY